MNDFPSLSGLHKDQRSYLQMSHVDTRAPKLTKQSPPVVVGFPRYCSRNTCLLRADTDWLLADDPGDALQQRGRGQRAQVRPVVQGAWEQGSRVETAKGGLFALKASKQRQEIRIKGNKPPRSSPSSPTFALILSNVSRTFCRLSFLLPI